VPPQKAGFSGRQVEAGIEREPEIGDIDLIAVPELDRLVDGPRSRLAGNDAPMVEKGKARTLSSEAR
jgi:hypothetical protein